MLNEFGIIPGAVMGHSVGEYVAATVAGIFHPPQAIRLVVARAKCIELSEPGAMASVVMPGDELQPLLSGRLEIAAYNSPLHHSVSGSESEITELIATVQRLAGC